ncbi:MAG: TolC family protein [Saprospiraceae bacterium]|nr:TolC family protein [Saprospiraceae bacterium]
MKELIVRFIGMVCLCLNLNLHAQAPLLTAEEATRMALENNFDIRLSRADADIAHLNNTKGNAGMLPTVNLVANENFTLSAFQQKLANGTEFVAAGAPFNNANAGVQLSWTLFDGRRMYIAKNRLEQTEALGQLNLQGAIQTTVANVLLTYFDVVRSQMQEKALIEVIALNEERLRIAEARLAAGFAAQTDALQAKIDLNQRRADLITQQNLTTTAKRNLNRLLARASDTGFEVPNTLESNYSPDAQALAEKVLGQNPNILSFQKSAEIAALLVDETRTLGKARITGIGQFNALRTDNGAGFALNNTQAGVTIGGSLTVPLYTGGNVKRQVETAKLAAQQAQIRLENQRTVVETELNNQMATLLVQKQLLTLEEENVKAARENLSVSTERFRVGTTNGLEPQTAQNTLEQALFRRNLVLYNLKIAELRLKFLAGEL